MYGLLGFIGYLGLAGVSALPPLPAHAEDSPQVFLSEINWAGSETSTADEWLELVNLGTTSVDLSHFVLTGVATNGDAIEIAEETILQPGQTLIIANYAANDPKSTLLISPDLVTTALSLPNSALDILLTTPAGLVIDSYRDAGTPDFGSTTPMISIERDLAILAWHSSTQNLGLRSTLQLGTPGHVDLPNPQAELASSPIVVTDSGLAEPSSISVSGDAEPSSAITPTSHEAIAETDQIVEPPSVDPLTMNEPIDVLGTAEPSSATTLTGHEAINETVVELPTVEIPEEQPMIDEPAPIEGLVTPVVETAPTDIVNNPETAPVPEAEPSSTNVLGTAEPSSATTFTGHEVPVITPSTSGTDLLTSSPRPSSEQATSSIVQPITPGTLVINELVSDPTDGVEWVEILNAGSSALDLTASTFVDAGDHVTNLPAQTLNAGEFLIIENPNGNLNNAGDTLTLLDAYGTELDTVAYGTADVPSPEDGEALARQPDGTWSITTATRGAPNVFAPMPSDDEILNDQYDPLSTDLYDQTTNESDTALLNPGTPAGGVATPDDPKPTEPEPVHRIVAIAKPVNVTTGGAGPSPARNKKPVTTAQITVEGPVIALPNTFGKQTMFIEGHEIYFNAAEWPELELGDVIRVSGTPTTNDGAERLKVRAAHDIVITGHVDLTAVPINGAELSTIPHSTLVSISGRVISKTGDKLTLVTNDGTEVTIVAYKKTNVTWSSIQSGAVTITGVIRLSDAGPRLYVRSIDDVHFTPETTFATTVTAKTKSKTKPLVGGSLLTGSIGALGTWYVRSKKMFSWFPF